MNQNPNQRIYDVVQEIGLKRYRIPSIQRGYEWQQARVLKLLDSIMNGYPIGAIMVWRPTTEVFKDIPNRSFVANFDSKRDYLSEPPHEAENDESYLVLDGQQRLQSLFLAFMGNFDGERVYMQVDYLASEDQDGDFGFEFLTPEEAKKRPEMVHIADIVKLDSESKFEVSEKVARTISSAGAEGPEREAFFNKKRGVIAKNIDRFIERFNVKTALFLQEVEQRHGYDHVLEIFERVNSGGMVLSKSDLLFSTIKLKLHQMEGKFAGTLEFLNQGDRHKFDTDFLIKAALVIFGQRAKYEVKKLKDDEFVDALKTRYDELHTCLRQLLAWLDDVALIKCDRFLRSQLALIPILDYMMLSGRRDKPDGANGQAMRQYLYMSAFLRTFSRSADPTLDRLHDMTGAAVKADPTKFPIQFLRTYIAERKGTAFDLADHQFTDDADLALNIVDKGVLQIDPTDPKRHSKDLKLEVDHIFPRTPLSKMGMADVVNHIGNYRLVVMPINRRKLASMPDDETDFFGRHDPVVEKVYQAALKNLNKETFLAFRDARAALIQKNVREFLGLNGALASEPLPEAEEAASTPNRRQPKERDPQPHDGKRCIVGMIGRNKVLVDAGDGAIIAQFEAASFDPEKEATTLGRTLVGQKDATDYAMTRLRRAWAEAKAPKIGPGFDDFFAAVIDRVKSGLPADLRTFKNTHARDRKKAEEWVRFHWRTTDVHVGLWAKRTPTGDEISVYFSNWEDNPEVAALLKSKSGSLPDALRLGPEDTFDPQHTLPIDKVVDEESAAQAVMTFLSTLKPLLGAKL